MQYVRSFNLVQDGATTTYVLRYDPETGQFEVIQQGPTPTPFYLTDEQLGVATGTTIFTTCVGTTLHAVTSQNAYPFAAVTVVPDSPFCGYTPPPPPPPDPGEEIETLDYSLIYRLSFSNMDQGFKEDETGEVETVDILICDSHSLMPGPVDVTYIDLIPTGDPLRMSTINNDEKKFIGPLATQATFQFYSTKDFNLNTFADGEDDRWKVFIRVQGVTVFTGFLVMDDLDEDFNFHPNAVTLTATDNIGLLKDVPLTDFTGTTPKGHKRIIDFIAWSLSKTGLQLDICLHDNLFEESYPNLPAFDNIYLHAKTFEDEIGTCEDCYTVLQKILKDEYNLKQHGNRWWINRVDEYENRDFFYFRFNYKGEYINRQSVNLTRYIGQNGEGESLYKIQHIENGTVVKPQRACNQIREVYNYNYPKELVDNIDFSRGQWFSIVSIPSKIVDGKTWDGTAYYLDDWQVHTGTFADPGQPNGYALIIRYFFEGIERERVLRLTSNTQTYQWALSNPIPVHDQDKVDFSVDARLLDKAVILNTPLQIQLVLGADDGTVYHAVGDLKSVILEDAETPIRWVPYTNELKGIRFNSGELINGEIWRTASTEGGIPPVPKTGNLFILLPFLAEEVIEYQNLKFEYQPFINGSYAEYTGQSHTITQTQPGFKAVREEEVFISDALKKLFKGALFKKVDDAFVLAGRWYDGAVFPDGVPSDEYLHSRGRTQAFSVWNQHNRTFRLIEATLQGLDSAGDVINNGLPDTVHKWVMADVTPHTYNKFFLLLHYEMDFYKCPWKGFFTEVNDIGIAKDYASKYEFKYSRNK